MIELIDVGKYYPTEFGKHWVFRHVTLSLALDKSVAVIGPNGAGKSTFLRILGGADIPSEGRITRQGNISPPMGLTPTLQPTLSGTENARFAGRIYGLTRNEIEDMIEEVRSTADIGKYFDLPVSTYSAGMRQRVAFSINISLHFDFYLFDEISAGGDREFRKFSKAKVKERLQTSKFIVASHNYDDLLDLCDAAIVIQNGELQYFDDIQAALEVYDVDSDTEEEDPRARRRAKRKSRAERMPAADPDVTDGLPMVAAGPSIDTDRDDLRQRRLSKLRADADPSAAASDEDPARKQRIRELREQLRTLRRDDGNEPADDSGRSARPADTMAGPAHPGADASDVSQTSTTPGAAAAGGGSENAAVADEGEAERLARRALSRKLAAERREKRRARRDAGQPDTSTDPASTGSRDEAQAVESDDPAADGVPDDAPSAEAGIRRRERRETRRKRDRHNDVMATDTVSSAMPSSAESDGERGTELAPVPPPGQAAHDASGESGSVHDAVARLRALSREPGLDWHQPLQDEPQPGEAATLRRAVFHQQRAQSKAARALRLLLQLIEQPVPGEEAAPSRRRLAAVAAAQEIARAEAAASRAIMAGPKDGSLSPPSPAAPLDPRPMYRHARSSLKPALSDPD